MFWLNKESESKKASHGRMEALQSNQPAEGRAIVAILNKTYSSTETIVEDGNWRSVVIKDDK